MTEKKVKPPKPYEQKQLKIHRGPFKFNVFVTIPKDLPSEKTLYEDGQIKSVKRINRKIIIAKPANSIFVSIQGLGLDFTDYKTAIPKVQGVAICHPGDEFNLSKGIAIAVDRCFAALLGYYKNKMAKICDQMGKFAGKYHYGKHDYEKFINDEMSKYDTCLADSCKCADHDLPTPEESNI